MNRDGVQDLAVANGAGVSVFLGNGDGSFQSALTVGVGDGPISVAVGDFNSDGAEDLAVANNASDTGSAILGNGDGSFVQPPIVRAGGLPISGVVADFNGDGRLDLGVANFGSNDFSVLLGNGDGTFQETRSFATGSKPLNIALGDFNGDGVRDVAVANRGTYPEYADASVSVLLGNGDGTFQEARNLDVGGSPRSIAVGDFNGDQVDDLVVAVYPSNVWLLLGNGDGIFQTPRSLSTEYDPRAVAVGDFNRDGANDLAIAFSRAFSGPVTILLGNGDGSFQPERNFDVGNGPVSMVVRDLNNDGVEDLAVARFCTTPRCYVGFASVLLGNGDGSFQPVRDYFVGNGAGNIVVADLNGDGAQDLAMLNGGNSFSVLVGNGDGTFRTPQTYAPGGAFVAAGDFNGDDRPDLALGSGAIFVLINDTPR